MEWIYKNLVFEKAHDVGAFKISFLIFGMVDYLFHWFGSIGDYSKMVSEIPSLQLQDNGKIIAPGYN